MTEASLRRNTLTLVEGNIMRVRLDEAVRCCSRYPPSSQSSPSHRRPLQGVAQSMSPPHATCKIIAEIHRELRARRRRDKGSGLRVPNSSTGFRSYEWSLNGMKMKGSEAGGEDLVAFCGCRKSLGFKRRGTQSPSRLGRLGYI